MFSTPSEVEKAHALKIPVVSVSGGVANPKIPCVTVDDVAVGKVAADHLLSNGFKRFGYYGAHDLWNSRNRGRGFAARDHFGGGAVMPASRFRRSMSSSRT